MAYTETKTEKRLNKLMSQLERRHPEEKALLSELSDLHTSETVAAEDRGARRQRRLVRRVLAGEIDPHGGLQAI